MVHIHPPKPLHGWREFFGEVGIIVIGVLIALGFEQVVEWAHWRHKVEQAQETLHDSIAHTSYPLLEQEIVGRCVDQQLANLETRLLAPGPFRPVPLYTDSSMMPFVYRAPARNYGDSNWRIITGEGVASHMPDELRAAVDRIYAYFDQLSQLAQQNNQVRWRLNSMAQASFSDRGVRETTVQAIEEMRGRNALMSLIAEYMLGNVKQIGMLPTASSTRKDVYDSSGTIAFCRAHGYPLDRIRLGAPN